MTLKLRPLALLPFLALAACSDDDTDVVAVDGGPDAPGSGGVAAANRTCDPLAPAPKPISWASIIAGGQSANGTIYAADRADSEARVFVSDASGTLVRQRVAGSGESPGLYTFTVTDSDSPFVLQIETAATGTRMGVLQGTLTDRKAIVIGQDGEELTVLATSAIAAMPVRNLPGVIVTEYVATLSDGRMMLVTRPRDDWSYQDFRLFLGPPSAVAERLVASVARMKDGGTTTIVFDLDGVQASAYFPVVFADGGFAHGPATLTVGNVVLPLERSTTSPPNATYLCFTSSTCVPLASVADQCPADWTAAIADESAFCATQAPFFDAFLSTTGCRGRLHYTKHLFDAGPRSCVYDEATHKLVGYRAVDGKAGFEQTSCGVSATDFDDQGCPGTTCAASAAASPTLETGVDRAALAAAVTAQVMAFVRATQPTAAAETIRLGRPWGQFDVHQGPSLVFRGTWRMLATLDGNDFAVVDASREGDSYKMTGIGSAQFVPTLLAREAIPAVSAALDRGRAGLLRRVGDGGDAFMAYEANGAVDGGAATIMVQPLGGGMAEMSLDAFNGTLPVE